MKNPLNTTHPYKHLEQHTGKPTLSTSVRGATHEQPIKDLEGLKVPKNWIQTLMKQLHQIPHIPNTKKRTLDNKQTPVDLF